MQKRFLLILMFLLPCIVAAQTGKIVGRVTDGDTGEPLIGANVLIEGTYYGASTNIDGDYLILNVDPGTFTLRAMYVGYQDVLIENVKISVNLTTEINFQLSSTAFEAEAIMIIAERPLINKNITNSTNIIRAEDIANLPVRNVSNIVAAEAGVVQQGGNLHVRGSRGDAVAYYIDGVLVNDPVFGGAETSLITNAIEEIQFQAGGYSAEFGGANGGIISTQSRSGSDKYKLGFEVITDNFIEPGEKYLGGYSYGYSEYVLTAGGPVHPSYNKLRFFVAANNIFQRSPARFYEGIDLKNLCDPTLGGAAQTFDVYYPDGYRLKQHQNTYKVQGNLTWDLKPFTLRMNGTYRYSEGLNGIALNRYNSRDRAGMNEHETITTSFKLTHVLGSNAFYDVVINYCNNFSIDHMDPIFKHNITAYGDSIENAEYGTTMDGDGQNPVNLRAYTFNFASATRPWDEYRKTSNVSYGGRVNLLYQYGKHHEIKAGGEANTYIIRRYALPVPISVASLQRSVADGNVLDMYNRLDNYGYDVYGNRTDSGIDDARRPLFAGCYIQDKMEFTDLIINAGLRLDYIDTDSKTFQNPHNVKFDENDELDFDYLDDIDPYIFVSPRFGFSFPVTEKTIFHAQYGKFVQQSRLRDVYQGYNVIADNIKGGFAIQAPVGFGLAPERTTSYEIGFKQQFGDLFAFDITAFYKDIKDQIQSRSVYADDDANHRQYYAFVNGDFSTVKGIEFKCDLRRVNRITASFDYTYSSAMGTGSNPSTGFRQIWQSPTADPYFPQQIAPLDFNQAHRGNLNLDYRFAKDDGPKFLEESGLNLLLTFNSGFNYTRWQGYGNARKPLESLNASVTPWVYQLDLRLDKSFRIGAFNTNVYLWVVNLLNRKNVIQVFNNSGDADDNGFLKADDGQAVIDGYMKFSEEDARIYQEMYKAMTYNHNNYATPRQIKLGLRVNF